MRKVLFRIDDAGLENDRFNQLAEMFISFQIPFAAGLIPIKEFPMIDNHQLVSFFQHGHRHVNRSLEAKKSEFPENIKLDQCLQEILEGWSLMEKTGLPLWKAFCPPWNRMREDLQLRLQQDYFLLGGKEMKRTKRSLPYDIDLHSKSFKPSLEEVLFALENEHAISVIMLHHTFMEQSDFNNLEELLRSLKNGNFYFINAKNDL